MPEIKGIDVSRWNGSIDWKTVANYGMGFAILRITEKGNIVDSTFEPNYKGCIENKIPVGAIKEEKDNFIKALLIIYIHSHTVFFMEERISSIRINNKQN